MSHFWSSTVKDSYIEPKREFQGVGVVDFVQPFLIQSMDKPSVKISNTKIKKLLTNGTIKTENHYKTDYELNDIKMTIIDAYDSGVLQDLNKAQTLYNLLSDGGYTLKSNQTGPARSLLRFPTFQILELAPVAKSKTQNMVNTAVSAAGNAFESLISGGGIGDMLAAVSTGTNFLTPNVVGIWTLQDPIITNVIFGGAVNYESEKVVKMSITLSYNNFKYEKSFI